MNIGWGKSIIEALNEYELPTDFSHIQSFTERQWTTIVRQKIEIKNKKRLYDDCHKMVNGNPTPKTKTAHIIPKIIEDTYTRKPQDDVMQCSKYETKTIIIARFCMLECGENFKGKLSESCSMCNMVDDEDHRLNYCIKYRDVNLYDDEVKGDFRKVYSENVNEIREILPIIQRIWDTKTAHGTMNI